MSTGKRKDEQYSQFPRVGRQDKQSRTPNEYYNRVGSQGPAPRTATGSIVPRNVQQRGHRSIIKENPMSFDGQDGHMTLSTANQTKYNANFRNTRPTLIPHGYATMQGFGGPALTNVEIMSLQKGVTSDRTQPAIHRNIKDLKHFKVTKLASGKQQIEGVHSFLRR